jgi:hypothetical protein
MPLDLRISLSKLDLFCLAAELQSFGRAAEQSFITQPVMTPHMRSLSSVSERTCSSATEIAWS